MGRAARGAQRLPALAADGKRIRGANRHTDDGVYFETVTLVTHDGRPLASRCCRDEGGERAATKASIGRTPALPAIRSGRKRTVGGKNPPCPVRTASRRLEASTRARAPNTHRGPRHR